MTALSGQLAIEFIGAFLIGMGSFGAPTIVSALLKRTVPAERRHQLERDDGVHLRQASGR